MPKSLQFEGMSVAEKLTAINDIWNSLIQDAGNVPSPDWHQEILQARQARVDNGVAEFSELDTVKKELREKFE